MIGTARRGSTVRVAAAALAAATALLLSGCATSSTDSLSTSTPSGAATSRPQTTTTGMPTAVVIGDSIAIGMGVPADDAWPLVAATRLGWNLTDFAESGAGFTRPGVNTHLFDDQVSATIRLHPQVVIVAATRNDIRSATSDPASLNAATSAAIDRLTIALPNATLIGMGAVWGATPPPSAASVIDDALRSAVLHAGGHWLDLGQPFTGRTDLLLADGVHPTSAGQSLLGRKVAEAVSSAGIEPGPASE